MRERQAMNQRDPSISLVGDFYIILADIFFEVQSGVYSRFIVV
jgi:hypothetical protein